MRRKPAVLLIFALLFLVVFFSSWIIQALALLMLIVLVLSYVYASFGYTYVTAVRRDRVLRAHRLQRLEIRLFVENRSPIPLHHIFVRDNTGQLFSVQDPSSFFPLAAWERRTVRYHVESRERGDFSVGPIVISGSDPLGLFPWSKEAGETLQVIIYPRVLPVQLAHRRGLPSGKIRTQARIYEDPTRYRSIREYGPGDDTRRINWKVSARMGDLFCMEYLPALSFPVLILLNLTTEDYPVRYREHRMERAIETAASLCAAFIGLGQEVGLVTSGALPGAANHHVIPVRGTSGQAVTVLECLAKIRPGTADFAGLLFEASLPIPYGTRIQVVSPPLEERQRALLETAVRKGSDVELFLVSGKTTAPEECRRFPCHQIRDYGHELFERRPVPLL